MSAARRFGCLAVMLMVACSEREQTVEPAKTKSTNRASTSTISTTAMMQLMTPSIAVGEKAVVRFAQPLDPAGEKYWITLVEKWRSDASWAAWQYVDTTTREVTLAPGAPGEYEVRLHDRYPAMPYHVIARSAVNVVGDAASESPSTDEQPAVVAAAVPDATSVPSVPESDVAAMAAVHFGEPTTSLDTLLHSRQWYKDGGRRETLTPSSGHRFLVVTFPNAEGVNSQVFYDSRQVFLHVDGAVLKPYAVTTGGASAPSESVASDGRRIFQQEVWVSYYAPSPDLPFAIAFEVPSDAKSGTLKLGKRDASLTW